MFAVVHLLTQAAETPLPGRIFVIPGPFFPWLAPVCILAGLGLQLGALAFLWARQKKWTLALRLMCALGALAVLVGAALDRDVAMAVGQMLALAGVWLAWRRA